VHRNDELTIGEVSRRSGIAPSALRYYESLGLIASTRTSGDRRRFRRAVLRRLAVVRAAQHVGLSLDEVRTAFTGLADYAAPTPRQWARMSETWRAGLDARIAELEQVRDNLASCGCLSMRQCALYNTQDMLAATGPGARRLLPGSL